jgi:SPP1 gp7 family putative phage head morphogenesis protein
VNEVILNIDIYNKWKRSTLDRLTGKHRAVYDRIVWAHLQSIRAQVERAIENNQKTIGVTAAGLEDQFHKVFNDHQADTTKVGVSDGIREVTPEKELGTWANYPWSIPVENTFQTLAGIKQRDGIFSSVWKKIFEKNKAEVKDNAKTGKENYLDNIKSVFKEFADDYYGTERWNKEPKSIANEFLKQVFDKTKNQAEAVFRTETTRYFNDSRDDYFKHHTDVDFVQLIAVTDGRVSKICESRDLYVIPIGKAGQKQYKPPFHVNCRTIQSPLMSYIKRHREQIEKNLGVEFGQVESNGYVFIGHRPRPTVPLPKGWV